MVRTMADPVKRKYHSQRRQAAAAATRARIREAATQLFVERGYAATAMREIAMVAGVGERTVYDAFPTKAALFTHTLAVAAVGDEDELVVAQRPEVLAALYEPDPPTALRMAVRYGTDLLERAGDLIMVGVEAAGSDPTMRAATDAGSRATHQVHLALARELHRRHVLRAGLNAQDAADIMYALLSPHLHQLLRRHRNWDLRRYRAWLDDTLAQQLLR